MDKFPKVGMGVIVIRNGKVLLGKRKNAHGDGDWAFPGGHLEFGEEIEDCVKREVSEETGLKVETATFAKLTNDIFLEEDKHYITIYMVTESKDGEARVMEPEKSEEWQWFEWGNLPQPLFLPIRNLLKTGFNPFKV